MSNVSAGTFTCSNLQTIIKRVEDHFNPANPNPDYMADAAPLQFIREIQTAQIGELQDSNKDYTVKVVYTDKCSVSVTEDFAETGTCSIDGVEAGQQCETYTLDVHKQSPGWKITNLKYRDLGPTSSLTTEMSVNMAAEVKAMDQILANTTVSKLNSWKGTNLYTAAPGSVSGTTTTIPATAWNPNLFAYLTVARQYNKLPNAKLFLGGLMDQALVLAELESNTEQGAANVRKVKALGKVWSDMFTTEAVLGAKAAFLVNPDSVAFVHQARYKPYGVGERRIVDGGGEQLLTIIESNAYPGVFYDMITQKTCVAGDDVLTGKLFFHGGWFLSPVRCNTSRTGVLKFACA